MIEGMLKSWYRARELRCYQRFHFSILAVISVLVILVGTYISLSEIKNTDKTSICGNDTNCITYVKERFFHSFMLFANEGGTKQSAII